jgi:hypothetical protein
MGWSQPDSYPILNPSQRDPNQEEMVELGKIGQGSFDRTEEMRDAILRSE